MNSTEHVRERCENVWCLVCFPQTAALTPGWPPATEPKRQRLVQYLARLNGAQVLVDLHTIEGEDPAVRISFKRDEDGRWGPSTVAEYQT